MSNNKIITIKDSEYEELSKDTLLSGKPKYVYKASDIGEVRNIIKECNKTNTPITFAASQTSMTGSSTTSDGIIVSIKNINRILNISKQQNIDTVTVEPAVVSSTLQEHLSSLNFYYPAVPTSKDESTIGGNVSTNAFGEDSFKYGPVRKFVRKLKVILSSGEELILERKENEEGSVELGKAGYFENWLNPIDLFIGSEGTLGFISEITLSLLPKEKPSFMILLPFDSNMSAISKIVDIVNLKQNDLKALEYIDLGAFENLKSAEGFPKTHLNAYLYLKIEYDDISNNLDKWTRLLSLNNSNPIIAKTNTDIEKMIKWRQHIPNVNKERKKACESLGGKKVSGDWWVPVSKLNEMMDFFYNGAKDIGCFFMAYAHLGQGHPHTSFFTENSKQESDARTFQVECAKKAVSLGGGAAGEHGIGKAYTHLLKIQHSKETIEKFIKWKKQYDPKNLFGRGNILSI